MGSSPHLAKNDNRRSSDDQRDRQPQQRHSRGYERNENKRRRRRHSDYRRSSDSLQFNSRDKKRKRDRSRSPKQRRRKSHGAGDEHYRRSSHELNSFEIKTSKKRRHSRGKRKRRKKSRDPARPKDNNKPKTDDSSNYQYEDKYERKSLRKKRRKKTDHYSNYEIVDKYDGKYSEIRRKQTSRHHSPKYNNNEPKTDDSSTFQIEDEYEGKTRRKKRRKRIEDYVNYDNVYVDKYEGKYAERKRKKESSDPSRPKDNNNETKIECSSYQRVDKYEGKSPKKKRRKRTDYYSSYAIVERHSSDTKRRYKSGDRINNNEPETVDFSTYQIEDIRKQITSDLLEAISKDIHKDMQKKIMELFLTWWDGQLKEHKSCNFSEPEQKRKENYSPMAVYDYYLNQKRTYYGATSILKKCDRIPESKEDSLEREDRTSEPKRWKWRDSMEKEEIDLMCDENDDNFELKDSPIHGLGLFAKKSFRSRQFVIEYKGERVTSREANLREMMYRKQGQKSCYFFSLDLEIHGVIDATVWGNVARYINHSCDPNCESVTSDSGKEIRFYSVKPIAVHDEITIDYKFAPEQYKIPCHCGAFNCRSALN